MAVSLSSEASGRSRTVLRGRAGVVLAAALTLTALEIPRPAGARSAGGLGPPVGVDSTVAALLRSAEPPPLPAGDPVTALARSVADLSAALGVPQDPRAAIAAADLPPEAAGRLAQTLDALHSCMKVSAGAASVLTSRTAPSPATVQAVRDCALRLHAAAAGLEQATKAPHAESRLSPLDLWPVLRLQPSGNDEYRHDYALLVDVAGNDVYANNAGGNLLDAENGPGTPGAARGCQLIEPGPHCVPGAALLLDLAGNDTYGVLQPPGADALCTGDPLIRRIVTQGAGLLGVGMLIDDQGNDRYTAKTLSQGSGHVAGVGVLHDRGVGNDTYVAIRNSQGFALVGGLGLHADDGGNDTFGAYMPGPLVPTAASDPTEQVKGGGGVIDDTGQCDKLPRHLQGSGNVGGVGVLYNAGGNDTYEASPPAVQNFVDGIRFAHSSQGYGACGAVGVLADTGGRDTYRFVSSTRVDGAQLQEVSMSCSGAPVAGIGAFRDSGA